MPITQIQNLSARQAKLLNTRRMTVAGTAKFDDGFGRAIAAGAAPGWYRAPFTSPDIIRQRQAAVKSFAGDNSFKTIIALGLGKDVSDWQRCLSWSPEEADQKQMSDVAGQIEHKISGHGITPEKEAEKHPDVSPLRELYNTLTEAYQIFMQAPADIKSDHEFLSCFLGLLSLINQEFRGIRKLAEIYENSQWTQEHYPRPEIIWTFPEIVEAESAGVKITSACHPLKVIHQLREERGESFYPVSLALERSSGAILTGPNEYGKTTTLKTLALLVILAQMGGPVPAQNMVLAPFESLLFFSSEGNQDIRQGLSGFSGECAQWSEANQALLGLRSLFIGDELCTTTDPDEGRPLLFSIIANLLQPSQTTWVLASHYRRGLEDLQARVPEINFLQVGEQVGEEAKYAISPGISQSSHALNVAERYFPKNVIADVKDWRR